MTEQTRPAEPSSPFEPGSVIDDRYEIVEFLGEGGFATVYKARHIHINRMLAIKILNTGLKVPKSSEFEQRFLREAQTAAQIHHANVVTIHDFGFAGPGRQPYIAMELLQGHDLEAELAKNGRLDPQRAVRLFAPCLEALGEGHKAGIIHKDLKPSNLFLCHSGERRELLQVLDFGVASINEGGKRLTSTGQILGTPQYLAPEYIKSQIAQPQLDVYQMGLILVEALTGQPVVDGESPFQCLMAHCNGNLQIPESLLAGPLGGVLRKALQLDHEQRYADANAFRAALLEVDLGALSSLTTGDLSALGKLEALEGRISIAETVDSMEIPALVRETSVQAARPSGAIPVTVPSLDLLPDGGPDQGTPAAASKRRPVVLFALVFAIALLAGVLIVLLASRDETEGRATATAENTAPEEPRTAPGVPDPAGDPNATRSNGSKTIDAPQTDPAGAVLPADPKTHDPELAAPGVLDPQTKPGGEDGAQSEVAAPAPQKVRVFVVSEPNGAEVFEGGTLLGTTPAVIEVAAGAAMTFQFRRKGYEAEEATFEPKDGATVSTTLRRSRRRGTADPAESTAAAKAQDDKPRDDKPRDDKPRDDKPKDIMLIAP